MNVDATQIAIVVIGLVLLYHVCCRKVEHFGAEYSDYEYDVKLLLGYLGPYISQIYMYLRAKYFDSIRNRSAMYVPTVNDPTLQDPALPPARSQIKIWIDSWKAQMQRMYPADQLPQFYQRQGVDYTTNADGTINVLYTKDGTTTSYLV